MLWLLIINCITIRENDPIFPYNNSGWQRKKTNTKNSRTPNKRYYFYTSTHRKRNARPGLAQIEQTKQHDPFRDTHMPKPFYNFNPMPVMVCSRKFPSLSTLFAYQFKTFFFCCFTYGGWEIEFYSLSGRCKDPMGNTKPKPRAAFFLSQDTPGSVPPAMRFYLNGITSGESARLYEQHQIIKTVREEICTSGIP